MGSMSFNQLMQKAQEAGGGFDPVPPDTYLAKVVNAQAVVASTGKDMIKVEFDIEIGPHKGRKVWNNYVLSTDNANALAFFFKHMKAFGLGPDYFAAEPSMQQIAASIQDKLVLLKLGIKTYENQDRNEVLATIPPPPEYMGAVSSAAPPADPFAVAQSGAAPAAAPAPDPFATTPGPTPAPNLPAPPF